MLWKKLLLYSTIFVLFILFTITSFGLLLFSFAALGPGLARGVTRTHRQWAALRVSIRHVDHIRSTLLLADGILFNPRRVLLIKKNTIMFFFLQSPASVYFFFLLQPWGLAWPGVSHAHTQTVGCTKSFHQAR